MGYLTVFMLSKPLGDPKPPPTPEEPLPPAPPHPDEPTPTARTSPVSQDVLDAPEERDSGPNRELRPEPGEGQRGRPGLDDSGRPGEVPPSPSDPLSPTAQEHSKPITHPPPPEHQPGAQPPAEHPVPDRDEPTPESADNEI